MASIVIHLHQSNINWPRRVKWWTRRHNFICCSSNSNLWFRVRHKADPLLLAKEKRARGAVIKTCQSISNESVLVSLLNDFIYASWCVLAREIHNYFFQVICLNRRLLIILTRIFIIDIDQNRWRILQCMISWSLCFDVFWVKIDPNDVDINFQHSFCWVVYLKVPRPLVADCNNLYVFYWYHDAMIMAQIGEIKYLIGMKLVWHLRMFCPAPKP